MKLAISIGVATLAGLSAGLVIPDEHVLQSLSLEQTGPSESFDLPDISDVLGGYTPAFAQQFSHDFETPDILEGAEVESALKFFQDEEPARQAEDLDRHPHKGHHKHAPNLTVFELISKSKYTTKLAKLISEYDDLVELLNGTTANFTVFAPTDKAFERIPKHGHKPSKEFIKDVLLYHISEDFYPAGRVLASRTIPTLLKSDELGGAPQRLSEQIGFRGLTLDFYSRIVAIDIFGTNGVIHGVDKILIPPFKAASIISLVPSEFSTLELALTKTGLYSALNDTSTHIGGTLFAPTNLAFAKLGPKINAFLFSPPGLKYLKALLLYHTVKGETLYSDTLYKSDGSIERIPKGHFHIDLATFLHSKHLSIDIARLGRIITFKINGFTTVSITDGVAKDGVIHVLSNVLIPPKHAAAGAITKYYMGEELTVDDLKQRLDGCGLVREEVEEESPRDLWEL